MRILRPYSFSFLDKNLDQGGNKWPGRANLRFFPQNKVVTCPWKHYLGDRPATKNLARKHAIACALPAMNVCCCHRLFNPTSFSMSSNNLLYQRFATLTTRERQKLRHWLQGEARGEQNMILCLFDVLNQSPLPSESDIWEALYPEEPFKDSRLRGLFNKLSAQLEQFLAVQALLRDELALDHHLLKEYAARQQMDLFDRALRRARKRLEDQPHRGRDYYRHLFALEAEQQQAQVQRPARKELRNEPQLIDAYDKSMLIQKFLLGIMSLNLGRLTGLQTPLRFMDTMVEELKYLPELPQDPVIDLLRRLYELIQGTAAAPAQQGPEVEALYKAFKEQHELFHYDNQKNFYFALTNCYLPVAYRDDQLEGYHFLHAMYLWGLEKNYWLVNGKMPLSAYKNMISLALNLGDVARAEAFMNSHRPLLADTPELEDCCQFCQALVGFHQKKFEETKQLLRHLGFASPFWEVNRRMLYIQVSYELGRPGEFDALFTVVNAFKAYLNQAKGLHGPHQALFRERITLLERLLRLQRNRSPRGYWESLRGDVLQFKSLEHRQWLLEKVDEQMEKGG